MTEEKMSILANKLLQTNSFSNKVLANLILEQSKELTCDAKYFKRMEKIRKRCYRLFLKSIDSQTAHKLIFLDTQLEKLIDEIEQKSGWFIYDDRAELRDNFTNQNDPEFATHDTYTVTRFEDGFHVTTEDKPQYILSEEQKFFKTYEKELSLIHEAFSEKERIMRGDYTIASNSIDAELLSCLVEYLGYGDDDTLEYSNVR